MIECWLPIPGYEGFYSVSDAGRVRSEPRAVANAGIFKAAKTQAIRGCVLAQTVNSFGYRYVSLARDGRHKRCRVHQLVLLAFVGPRPTGLQGCHGDGDPANNARTNLRYGTPRDNAEDRVRHGRAGIARGESHGSSKLTISQVASIRADGRAHRAIACDYGVAQPTISRIKRGATWNSAGDSRVREVQHG